MNRVLLYQSLILQLLKITCHVCRVCCSGVDTRFFFKEGVADTLGFLNQCGMPTKILQS